MNLILMLTEKQNKQMRKNKVAPIIQAIFKKRVNQDEKLDSFHESYVDFNGSMYEGRNDRVRDLENKLDTIKRIADYE